MSRETDGAMGWQEHNTSMFRSNQRDRQTTFSSIWLIGALLVASGLLTAYRAAIYPPERLAEAMAAQEAARERTFHLVAVTLQRIRTKYVDPGRTNPRRMFLAALQALQDELAEVIAERPKDHNKVQLRVGVYKKTFNVAAIESFSALYASLVQALAFINHHVADADRLRNIQYTAISGLLSALDPHSMLLDPDLYANLKMGTKGSFGGLGIVVSLQADKLTVVAPIDDTPASKAGIKAGDIIVKIDNEATAGMTLNEAVDLLRGPPGSAVVLWIQRRGWPEPRAFRLLRAVIKLKTVSWRLLPSRVGYIRIKQFAKTTPKDVADAILALERKHAKGLILDLYNNPGGLVESAVRVADLFVDRGTILTTVSEAGRERDRIQAHEENTKWRGALLVLVNEGSASASEILAGALKGLDRALIVGQKTFGKGSVQVLFDNDDGSALKLTVAQFLTPPRVAIQSQGIIPDMELVPMIVDKTRGVHLSTHHKARRERDLARHLSAHWGADFQRPPLVRLRYLNQARHGTRFHGAGPNAAPAAVLEIASRVISSHIGNRRSQARERIAGIVEELRATQNKRLIEALADLNVDWKLGAATQSPLLVAEVHSDPPDAVVTAGGSLSIKVDVTNLGKGPAYRVWATTETSSRLIEAQDFVFGRIDPGTTRSWTVRVTIPGSAVTRIEPLAIRFFEEYGHACPGWRALLRIRGRLRPLFALQYHIQDEAEGNGDGLLQRGERARLRFTVRNIGRGDALDTLVVVRNRSRTDLRLKQARISLGRIAPGREAHGFLDIETPRSPRRRNVVLDLRVADSILGTSVRNRIVLPLAEPDLVVSDMAQQVRVRTAHAELRGGANPKAPLLGRLAAGSILLADGKVHGWYRVRLKGDDNGFVAAGDLVPLTSKRRILVHLKRHFQITPPLLRVDQISRLVTADHVRIRAQAVDDERIKDMYVDVSSANRPWHSTKVFYEPNRFARDQARMTISTDVPLQPGQNIIRVVARQTAWIQTTKLLVVTRQAP